MEGLLFVGFEEIKTSVKGYSAAKFAHDVASGLVVAALSMPIAMGYAEICGVPVSYGIVASIVAPLVYALITSSPKTVFGMDSATSAMVGAGVAALGVATQSENAVGAVAALTLISALFLIVFAGLRAGRLVQYVPAPVLHGFIFGISLTIVINQIPAITGTGVSLAGDIVNDFAAIGTAIMSANPANTLLFLMCFLALLSFERGYPKLPASLIVLALATAFARFANLEDSGVILLGTLPSCVPAFALPSFEGLSIPALILWGFSIAIVIMLESLMCLRAMSSVAGTPERPNRELLSFGVSNVACAFFGAPPSAASMSRTAANVSAGAKTRISSIVSALGMFAVAAFLAPFLTSVPRATLSAVIVLAMYHLVDFKKIRRYARHMRIELVVFTLTALATFAAGAIAGIVMGIIASILFSLYRNKRPDDPKMMGIIASPAMEKALVDGRSSVNIEDEDVVVCNLSGRLNFLNIASAMRGIENLLKTSPDTVILELTEVVSLDASATDMILAFLATQKASGKNILVVRHMGITDDPYTRFELKRIMKKSSSFPSKTAAMLSLEKGGLPGKSKVRKEAITNNSEQMDSDVSQAKPSKRS